MANIPFDFIQYCVTEEPMTGVTLTPVDVFAGSGETYIGLYNFNPGFNGRIKNISVNTKPLVIGGENTTVSGELKLKARRITDTVWTDLQSIELNQDTANKTNTFNFMKFSGESPITTLGDVPWIIATTGIINAGTPPTLGANLILDSNFTNAALWTLGANWTLSGGLLSATTAASSGVSPNPSLAIVAGTLLKVNYTITSYTSGSVRFYTSYSSTVNYGKVRSAVGDYEEFVYTVAGGNNGVAILGASFVGSIDNFEVREVSVQGSPSKVNITRPQVLVRCMGETI